MTIYEVRGYSSILHPYDKKNIFDYLADFKPLIVPEGADIEDYKKKQAPYIISGRMTADDKGTIRRSNDNLISRDMIFLDYDSLTPDDAFVDRVAFALSPYSYIIWPTIKHTADRPRYRLAVLPSQSLERDAYAQAVREIAELIGLPFDLASLTWSQLQGLPITLGNPEDYQKIINKGRPYPVRSAGQYHAPQAPKQAPGRPSGLSMTMRVVNTLLNGYGDEGGRNTALASFCGLLFNKWVDCDLATAWELVQVANTQTAQPLPLSEVEKTFESIARAEYRKRGTRSSTSRN